MKYSVKKELLQYGIERLKDLSPSSKELCEPSEIHHQIFNVDYYIIGYYEANQWLKEHEIDVFEGIQFCQEKEEENFGEVYGKFDNSEILVNHIVYWVGYDLIMDIISKYKNEED
jgi:hypothetical protein